jgi:HK97 family phage prohead protease
MEQKLFKQATATVGRVERGEAQRLGAAEPERVRKFVISTGSPDRDNDTVAVNGWRLDAYRKNPVVLWAHDYAQLPVARCLQVGVDGQRLVALAEFATHAFADTVLQLIDGGFLRATSVGFRPLKYTANAARGGYDFTEQELLEFSVVPVPANAEALIAAGMKSRSRPGDDLLEIDDDVLEIVDDGGGEVLDARLVRAAVAEALPELIGEAVRVRDAMIAREVRRTVERHRGNVDAADAGDFAPAPRRGHRLTW